MNPERAPRIAPDVCAILLAAGESRRMNGLKALLTWQGRPLIAYQIETLLQVAAQVLVVLGHAHEKLRPHIPDHPAVSVVMNPNYTHGRTSSIKAGLGHISPQAATLIIHSVDQPRPVAMLQELVNTHIQQRSLITIPTYQGRRGHPPIFSLHLLAELREISEERAGLRELMAHHHAEIIEMEFDSSAILTDLNRPLDYQVAKLRYAAFPPWR